MEPKLETISSGRFLSDVAYSNSTKKTGFIFELKQKSKKMGRPVNFKKCIKLVDFEQPSWNPHSKRFEAAVIERCGLH